MCPVAWQGQYEGKEKKPVCRLEVVCDDKLRIWHVAFGMPGAMNDLSILDQSEFFNKVRSGRWLPVRPQFCVAGFNIELFYYLVDGIYPKYRIFVGPLGEPRTAKEKLFAGHQSAARKAVESVFGVMFKRFGSLYAPCRLWKKEDMDNIVRACCIIHNMVCDERKDMINETQNVRSAQNEYEQS